MGDHTYYGFWSRSGKTGQWTHLVTMDVAAKEAFFEGGTDAFIEDWLETGKNARTSICAAAGNADSTVSGTPSDGAVLGELLGLDPGKRSFNFKTNWNGGVAKDAAGEFYFMTAGGKATQPTTKNPSQHAIKRTAPSRLCALKN